MLRNDLSRRAEILGESLQESLEPLLDSAPDRNLQRLVGRSTIRTKRLRAFAALPLSAW